MKKCLYCGREIPEEANFCFSCAKSQIEKSEPAIPALNRRKIIITASVSAAVILVVTICFLIFGRKTLDNGGAELLYLRGGHSWHLLLRNSANDDFHWKSPQDTYSRRVQKDVQAAVPLQLYVYDEETGTSAAEKFMDELDRSEIKVIPASGSTAADSSIPAYNPGFPLAAMAADIVYDATCLQNEIIWILHMKNKDTLILHESLELTLLNDVTYDYNTTPLSSTDELQTLINGLSSDNGETLINIILAPVVYEGDIVISNADISLTGSSADGQRTIFKGKIIYRSSHSLSKTVSNIEFEGADSGIETGTSFFIEECSFTGCKMGINGQEGSWPMPYDCTFTDCRMGLAIDSSSSDSKNAYFGKLSFKRCGTAVYLKHMPASDVLYFIDCSFTGNDTDVQNLAGNEISYSLE